MVEGESVHITNLPEEIQEKSNIIQKKRNKDDKFTTKVVVRRLPPTMTEESFLEHISPLFEHDHFYYVQADHPELGDFNFSRAYINFINVEDIITFVQKFDDYVFIDEFGNEYPAIVEFAPYQRIPRMNRKPDPCCGTIDEDPYYIDFVTAIELEEQDVKSNIVPEHYYDMVNDDNDAKDSTTPLLEFLSIKKKYKEEKKEDRRRREKRIEKEPKRTRKLPSTSIPEKFSRYREDRKKDEIIDEAKPVTPVKTKAKSYQEERQRDLARRRNEEIPSGSGDMKETKDSLVDRFSKNDIESECDEVMKPNRCVDKVEDDYQKKYEEKKSYRNDDRRYNYPKEKDDKKSYYRERKRDYGNDGGYHDNEFKSKSYSVKKESHCDDDYKTKNHSSYQKSNSHSKSKDEERERNIKRFDKTKFDDCKDETKSFFGNKGDIKSTVTETKADIVECEKTYKVEESRSKRFECEKSYKSEEMKYKKGDHEKPHKLEETTVIKNENEKKSYKSRQERGDDVKEERPARRIKNKDRPAMEIYRPGKFSRQKIERSKSKEEE